MTCVFEILNLGGASEKHRRVEHPYVTSRAKGEGSLDFGCKGGG